MSMTQHTPGYQAQSAALPPPAGWITNWKEFQQRRSAVIYSYCWRPNEVPHPMDVAMFTGDQLSNCISETAAERDRLRAVNAELLAALIALRNIEFGDSEDDICAVRTQCDAAISRATGA